MVHAPAEKVVMQPGCERGGIRNITHGLAFPTGAADFRNAALPTKYIIKSTLSSVISSAAAY